ncbi:MAG: membrane-associated protease RseP (regulator of RpoE activity) [Pseudoalteromonas tetraodonis]|jgi:membrane-associated protease RseP (regulator of RpoE activity)
MKIKTITTLLLTAIPGFVFADLVDFGTTTKPNKGGGFLVTGVFQGTPAAELGISEGDVVTKLDGSKLQPTTSLARLVAGVREADSEVSVDWTRGDERMTGKATLGSTLSEEAFEQRYPNAALPKSSKSKSRIFGNVDELDGIEDLAGLGIDVKELQIQLQDALGGAGLGGLVSGASSSFSVMKMSSSPTGSRVTVSGSGKGKSHVKIETKGGEVIFDEKISEEELDRVPEAERATVKGLMGNGISVDIRGFTGGDDDVEESAADLLKKVEEEKEGDEKAEDK